MPCNIDDQYSEIAEGLKAEEIVVKVWWVTHSKMFAVLGADFGAMLGSGPEGPEEDWCDGDVVNPIVAPEVVDGDVVNPIVAPEVVRSWTMAVGVATSHHSLVFSRAVQRPLFAVSVKIRVVL